MWKFVGPGVVFAAIQEKMGPILQNWLLTPVPTGRKRTVKGEDGPEEVPELLSPVEQMMTVAGEVLYRKMLGKVGGDYKKRQAVQDDIVEGLQNPGNPFASMLNGINPRLLERAIKDGDYVPILLDQFGPMIQRWAETKFNSGGSQLQ